MTKNGNGQGPNLPALPIPTREDLLKAGINIAVSVPMERNVSDVAFYYFWNIANQGWPLIDHLYGRTDTNRNRCAEFIKANPEFTHLAMLDLDHMHPRDSILKLARWVLDDPSKLIISGLHFRRGQPFDPCMYVYGEDGELHAPLDWPQGLVKVDAIGHGTVLISRKVFEILEPPYWAYSYIHAPKFYPSEDMFFSHMAREAGINMFVDTTQTSPHLITTAVEESSFRQFLSENDHAVIDNGEKRQVKAGRVYKPKPKKKKAVKA